MGVHAAGRVPEIKGLNLDAAGIEWEKQGVRVNEFLQSVSIPAVYAAGDAAASGGPPLAPVASYEGLIVAQTSCGETIRDQITSAFRRSSSRSHRSLLSVSVNEGHVS